MNNQNKQLKSLPWSFTAPKWPLNTLFVGPQWFCGYATLELKNIYTTLVLKNIMLIKVAVEFSVFDNHKFLDTQPSL
jgi:hypothetical protein